jgi:ribonuclease HI
MRATLNTDGGARGNPGPAGIGVVLRDDDGDVVAELSQPIGETTNNVAEYTALIEGLELARRHGATHVDVRVDSELVASQVKGEWRIRNDRLRTLAARARALLGRFDGFTVTHVRRELNAQADALANQAMDEAELGREDGLGQGFLI